MSIDATKAIHTCLAERSNSSPNERRVDGVFDARVEMRELCSIMALEDTAKSSIQIANQIVTEIAAKYTQLGKLQDVECYLADASTFSNAASFVL